MKHQNAWILLIATAAVVIAAMLFHPKPTPPKETAPVHAGDRGGIVVLGDKALIDINTASRELLEELPGIGEVMAQALIEGRPYKDLEDLRRVKGIGDAMIESLRDKVAFGDNVTSP